MLDLMAVTDDDGSSPLYVHTVRRILREMRIVQQELGQSFDYVQFKERLSLASLSSAQMGPLEQRLELLESFMQTSPSVVFQKKKKKAAFHRRGVDWSPKVCMQRKSLILANTPQPGLLTIVDLSCPCITPEAACMLFNVCLSIFLEQDPRVGRIVALDEAHKVCNCHY